VNSKLMQRVRSYFTGHVQATTDNSLHLLGRMASWQVRSLKSVPSLHNVEFKVFSQWGEDGIIDFLIERAQIPARIHSFVEFGIESYAEANTRFLLENRNWRGLVIDSAGQIELLKKRESHLFWRYDLTAVAAFVTRENINELLLKSGFSGEIGLLSIDIDGNDYWVWEAINAVRPVICICEYNAVFGDVWPLSIPYEEKFVRTRPEFNNLYFGASIVALDSLANRKGYRFLGTNSEGVNAFFIREDYASCFDSLIASPLAQPSKFCESRDPSGRLSYVRGLERPRLIRELPVVNTETREIHILGNIKPLYSEKWLEILESSLVPNTAVADCAR
jgi:hypothetical protein